MKRLYASLEDQLLAHRTICETGCWEWSGALNNKGYGRVVFSSEGRRMELLTHRAAAHVWLGVPLGTTDSVCHHCDNPTCFNPSHLFMGTIKDNMQDALRKGRLNLRGLDDYRRSRSKLTDEQVREVRAVVASGVALTEVARRFNIDKSYAWRVSRRLMRGGVQ